MTLAQQPTIRYTLGMTKPSTHLLEVELAYDHLPPGGADLDLLLPVWRPGRYVVMDLAGGVISFAAADGRGNSLPWVKVDKSRWRVRRGGATDVRVRYTVYANEFSLRTRGLNDEHAFVDGAAVFLYAEEYRRLPVTLEVRPYGGWHVTTGMEGSGTRFTAPDYDAFIDCPLEIGTQSDTKFDVDGVEHVLSIFGAGNYDTGKLVRDITAIVRTTKAFWGEFPYRRYVFLLHCTPTSGGGTEHLNSTIMGIRPFVFKNPDSYHGFLSLVSHEYFHTWNVKQLRPKGITPYDYTKENYTGELWISEGTTSYYDEVLLVRAGLATPDKYLEAVQGAVLSDRQRPGNAVQSLSASSFDAWIKYNRGTQQAFNTESDFYDKGASVSMILDLDIRRRTSNAHSLDAVLRGLAARFPLGGGFDQEDVLRVLSDTTGEDFRPFFDSYVNGTAPLPWEEALAAAGLEIVRRDSSAKPWIGLASSDADGRTRVTRVPSGSPAYEAGIDPGDEIVALNGIRARSSDIADRVAELAPGDRVRITLFRNEQLREFTVTVGTQSVPAISVRRVAAPTELQKSIYQAWLAAPWK
jgi:predicted metalloprotease with PDZ domain